MFGNIPGRLYHLGFPPYHNGLTFGVDQKLDHKNHATLSLAYLFCENSFYNKSALSLRWYIDPAPNRPSGTFLALGAQTLNILKDSQPLPDTSLGWFVGKKVYLTNFGVENPSKKPYYEMNLYVTGSVGTEYRFNQEAFCPRFGFEMGVEM